jgi:hypothetical protein
MPTSYSPEWLDEIIRIYFPEGAAIPQVRHWCDTHSQWSEEWESKAVSQQKDTLLRRLFGQITDEHGVRRYHNVVRRSQSGEKEQLYLSEEFMEPSDYQYVVEEYYKKSRYFRRMGEVLATRCEIRYTGEHIWRYDEWIQLQRDDDPGYTADPDEDC